MAGQEVWSNAEALLGDWLRRAREGTFTPRGRKAGAYHKLLAEYTGDRDKHRSRNSGFCRDRTERIRNRQGSVRSIEHANCRIDRAANSLRLRPTERAA